MTPTSPTPNAPGDLSVQQKADAVREAAIKNNTAETISGTQKPKQEPLEGTEPGASAATPPKIVSSATDAINTENTTEASDEDASKKERDTSKHADITSLAQLRDWHISQGTAPTQDEIATVKKREQEILEEGAKHVRGPAAER